MTEVSTWILLAALVAVPAIAMTTEWREGLFALLRLTAATIGVPWP